MVLRKEQIKTPEKELGNKEITNQSDAEFKTLVIRMLTEMVEYGCKIDKKVKAMKSEIKENVQGTNSEGKEIGPQINDLEQKEETRIQKYEEKLRNLWDNFKHSNIRIIGVPEGEEKEQEVENLFEQIMKENMPNLAKEIDFQEVQEAHRIPKKLDPRRNIPRHIILSYPRLKTRRES